MSNKFKNMIEKIEIPEDLGGRTAAGIRKAKEEMKNKPRNPWLRSLSVVAIVAALISFLFLGKALINFLDKETSPPLASNTEEGVVIIPEIEIDLSDDTSDFDMMALLSYKGRIYQETDSYVTEEAAGKLLGKKLARTRDSLDEDSDFAYYEEELASSIGVKEIYAVKGYDESFRVMAYEIYEGDLYVQFFEHLTDISLTSGEDIFGQLKLRDRVEKVEYRNYDDWYYERDHFRVLEEGEFLESFIEALYEAKPRQLDEEGYFNQFSNENFKELRLHLVDDVLVSLRLTKNGHIHYGNIPVYFQLERDIYKEIWELMQ